VARGDLRADRVLRWPAEQFAAAIARGDLAPGDRLDGEIQLADRLGLSRPTVRQAIGHLVDKGLIVRRRGVGTQVVRSEIRRAVALTSLYDDLLRGQAGRFMLREDFEEIYLRGHAVMTFCQR